MMYIHKSKYSKEQSILRRILSKKEILLRGCSVLRFGNKFVAALFSQKEIQKRYTVLCCIL